MGSEHDGTIGARRAGKVLLQGRGRAFGEVRRFKRYLLPTSISSCPKAVAGIPERIGGIWEVTDAN